MVPAAAVGHKRDAGRSATKAEDRPIIPMPRASLKLMALGRSEPEGGRRKEEGGRGKEKGNRRKRNMREIGWAKRCLEGRCGGGYSTIMRAFWSRCLLASGSTPASAGP
jgi:hypothetical protein